MWRRAEAGGGESELRAGSAKASVSERPSERCVVRKDSRATPECTLSIRSEMGSALVRRGTGGSERGGAAIDGQRRTGQWR